MEKDIGERIKKARLKKGFTQERLASLIGVAKSTLTGYEKGNSEPNLKIIKKIIEVLDVDANYLLNYYGHSEFECTLSEQSLIKKYRMLTEEDQKLVEMFLERMIIHETN